MVGTFPIVADGWFAYLRSWIEKGQIEIVSGASERCSAKGSENLQSKGWAKSVTDLKQKILRNVERAGSLALHTEQETGPFGLIRQALLVRAETEMDRDWLGTDVLDRRDVFPLIRADHVVCFPSCQL